MPRYIEAKPSQIKKGDYHVDAGNRVQWFALANAERLEDGRVVVRVEYPVPSTLAKQQGTAEWGSDTGEVRILRRTAR